MKYGKILVMFTLVAAANAFPWLAFPTFPGARPDIPVFSPDGSKVAYVSDGFGCYYINIVNADGSQNKKYFLPFYISSRLYFSPDGSKIACIGTDVYYGISNIFLLDVVDLYKKRVTAYGENRVEKERWGFRGGPPLFNNHLTFSPNGRRIFYGSNESGSKGIVAINVDGTGKTLLSRLFGRDEYPVYLKDVDKILFEHDEHDEDVAGLWIMNPDGSAKKRLPLPWDVRLITVSPDGKKIAYKIYDGATYVADWDGSNRIKIADGEYHYPAFSPDGKRIVYALSNGISIVNADGSGRKALTTGWYYAGSPEFYTDGSKIVFRGKYTAGSHESSIYTMDTDGSNLKPFGAKEVLSPWRFSVSPTGDKFVIEGIISGEPQCRYAIFNADGSGMVRLLSGE